MDLLFPDTGLVYQMSAVLTNKVNYHLYTNNYTPTLSTVLGDLTEAAWSGYAAITQQFSDFTLNGVAAHNGYAIAPPITFANSSGVSQTAYGYYVTDHSNATLLAVALFDTPLVLPTGVGGNVTPVWGDYSGLSS